MNDKIDLTCCSALLLNSGGGWNPREEGSYIVFGKPEFSFFSVDRSITFENAAKKTDLIRHPLLVLRDFLSDGYIAVGYIAYEYSEFTEEGFSPTRLKDGERFPDMHFLFYKEEDINSGRIEELGYESKYISHMLINTVGYEGFISSNMSKGEYLNTVKLAKGFIERGDIYQINLSQRLRAKFNTDPLKYFLDLYHIQPVPYGCYINFGDYKLISGSMELFLRRKGNKIATKPIKGTRKRGNSADLDELLISELSRSEKDRAENLMIVDLMRNDLGRICGHGTINVRCLFNIESYSTLHQMVSEVEGYIKSNMELKDIIGNTFPPGSVTGAPKKRTLEIIDELEPHYRGPYCGVIGIFMPNGDLTLSVAIRIVVIRNDMATFWVGSGIVWDSEPEDEYEETLIKANAILKAMSVVS
ncbi:MAG: anthranilate synthase component I family protein [Deltaproteobacteria bacterium]|nr:anthranilate synthase component I family protein [Deltaproteobacteria bacterium]